MVTARLILSREVCSVVVGVNRDYLGGLRFSTMLYLLILR